MIEIRNVKFEDKEFWFTLDSHLEEKEFDKKVRDKQGYVITYNGKQVGLLRYNLFWDNTPFCNLLYIQGKGYGSKLMKYWEDEMKLLGYPFVLVSTQVDEEAQHFYRKLGYKDCGGFNIDIPGYEQPMELFMIKNIKC